VVANICAIIWLHKKFSNFFQEAAQTHHQFYATDLKPETYPQALQNTAPGMVEFSEDLFLN
jgi:hypothetical protein